MPRVGFEKEMFEKQNSLSFEKFQIFEFEPVIMIDPSTGQWFASSCVSVLLNIAGVDANLDYIYCSS